MATYVDQAYYGWSHEELSHQDESREVSDSQMLDHGSISFGRFAYESLSWEKRSVFTHNKCQEELEKFKSPGLVAKKKAYFEEYYKRIRAMKALQENQQTELTLDYGGDGSISSQTGEEDEAAVQLESLGDGAANVVFHSKEASIEEKEKETECSEALEVQSRHPDLETTSPNLDSSRNNFEDLEQEDNIIYPLQMPQLDTEIPAHKSLTRSIEETEQHDLSNLDDKGVSTENSNSVTNIEPEVASQATTLYPTKSKPEDLELKPAHNLVSAKSMPAVRKFKDRVSVPKVKEPSAPARYGSKLEDKTKSDIVKPSWGPKYPFQKTIVTSGNGIGSSKATADKVSRNYKSTSVSSHRPPTEVHSNVTTPHPFSLATHRRAAVSSGSREGALKLDSKTSNKQGSSAVHGKDAINVQGSSKRTIINSGMKSRGLENKRGHEERKKPLASDSQCASLKARVANVLGPLKARSINLPPHSKFSSNGGIDNRFKDAVREDKRKEGKDEARLREVRRAGTKIVAPPPAGNPRTETKKILPSWTGNLLLNSRKPRFGEQSFDGKKPRQEKPRWR